MSLVYSFLNLINNNGMTLLSLWNVMMITSKIKMQSFTYKHYLINLNSNWSHKAIYGDKKCYDKEQIGVKEPFPISNCQFTS